MKVVLASRSPRRKELLSKIFSEFEIVTKETDETLPSGVHPKQGVEILAVRKGEAVLSEVGMDALVISSDTLVELDGKPLGKPTDEEDAVNILLSLSGKTHNVHTGVAVHYMGRLYSGVDTSSVTFRCFGEEETREYVKTGEPMDKAGAYAIQGIGAALVEKYEGEFDVIVGLGLKLTEKLINMAVKMTKSEKRERLGLIVQKLKEIYPVAKCALEYGTDPWRLLVMARLSAQCTDARVNVVSKELFSRFPDAESMAYADVSEIERIVKPCGLYKMKASNIKDSSRLLVEKYGGKLPDSMEDLLSFPGVGRKIANLILGDIFSLPAVVCDTHCIRICGRLGMYPERERNPGKIEKILKSLIAPEESSDFCHRIVIFGREICTARSPLCDACPLSELCERKRRVL